MKILIADDSIIARKGIRTMLSSTGAEIIEAQNGEEAYFLINSQKPDCVLLDLLMPVMTGFEVLEKLKDKDFNHKIIIVSADIQTSTLQQCADLGSGHFLNKPPLKEELLNAIHKVCDYDGK